MALTDYEKYIRTEELLASQKPAGGLSYHDELQFQIVPFTAAQAATGHDPGYHG